MPYPDYSDYDDREDDRENDLYTIKYDWEEDGDDRRKYLDWEDE